MKQHHTIESAIAKLAQAIEVARELCNGKELDGLEDDQHAYGLLVGISNDLHMAALDTVALCKRLNRIKENPR